MPSPSPPTDGLKGGTDSITVTINVSNVNEAPTAVNDTATTDEDQSGQTSTCWATTRIPIRSEPA